MPKQNPVPNQIVKARVDRLWMVDPGTIRGLVHGQLPNKSNSKRIIFFKGHPKLTSGQDVVDYTSRFELAVWANLSKLGQLPEDEKLYLKATVHQENMQRDLDCELLPDLLQRFNIIKNDRAFWRKEYERRLDRENPRVEFEVGLWRLPGDKTLFD
jgi:hypothetical protein